MGKINSKIKIVFFLLFLIFSKNLKGQNYTVTGIINNNIKNKNQGIAYLLTLQDSSYITKVIIDNKGRFEIKDIDSGAYLLVISIPAYYPKYQTISLNSKNKKIVIDITDLPFQLDSLTPITVKSVLPIVNKKDTIEYNAVSFKTEINDNVEMLLKKLPGLQIDGNGKITANGKEITTVLVDGQPFFGNNPLMATRNLPAEIISKVQIYDATSDKHQITTIEDGQRTPTINLKIKSNRKRGNFGQIAAGMGVKNVNTEGAVLNHFQDSKQVSLVAQQTNIPNTLIASPITLPMSSGSGKSNAWGAGINYRDKWGTRTNVTGNYQYGNQNFKSLSFLTSNYAFPNDSATQSNQLGNQDRKSYTQKAVLNIETMFNPKTKLIVRPQLNISNNTSSSSQFTMLQNLGKNSDTIYTSSNNSNATTNSRSYGTVINFYKGFKKELSSLSVETRVDFRDVSTNQNNTVSTRYKLNDSIANVNLMNLTKNTQRAFSSNWTYSEPIAKNQALLIINNLNYNISNNNINVYNILPTGTKIIDTSLTNAFQNNTLQNTTSIGYQLSKKKYTLNLTIGNLLQSIATVNKTVNYKLNQQYDNLSAAANFVYNFTSSRNFSIGYSNSYSVPSADQLQPITRTQDSLFIQKGNPGLKPSQQNNFSLSFQNSNALKEKFVTIFLNGGITTNNIQNKVEQSENGTQISTPVNINGFFNINSGVSYGFSLKNIKSNITLGSQVGLSHSKSILNDAYNVFDSYVISGSAALQTTINNNSSFELKSNSLVNISTYSISSKSNTQTFTQSLNGNFVYAIKNNYSLSSDFNLQYNEGYGTSYQKFVPIVSFKLSRILFKNKSASLNVFIYDALNKAVAISRSASTNLTSVSSTNIQSRYLLVSFIYNFRKFRK